MLPQLALNSVLNFKPSWFENISKMAFRSDGFHQPLKSLMRWQKSWTIPCLGHAYSKVTTVCMTSMKYSRLDQMQEPESNGFKLSIPKVQSIGSLWKSQAVHALSDWSFETQLDLSMMQAWSLPHRRQLPVMRLTLSSMRNQLGIFPTSCPWLSSPSWSPKSYLECAHDEQNFDSTNVKARPVHMCLRSFPHGTRGFFQKPVVAAASGLEGGISLSNSAISDA